jgi:peptide subunit release factor 1 (eRF1)
MNIYQKINSLKKLQNLSYRLLTVYLSFAGIKTPANSELIREFRSQITKNLTREERKHFKNSIKRINQYLEESYDSRGKRSIAFFCGGDLFEVLEFEFPLPAVCTVSNSAFLDPIISQVREHNKYAVILVDRKKARFFSVQLGEMVEHGDLVVDMVPQDVKANEEHYYGRSDKISRHIEDHLARYLNIVAERVSEFVELQRPGFILLGGHEELFERVKKHLPKYIRDKITGEFLSELNVPLNDIFLASKKAAEHLGKEKEYQRMERALGA